MKKIWDFKNELADVEALVEKAIYLTAAYENRNLRSTKTANGVLMFAADYLLSCRRIGRCVAADYGPMPNEVERVIGNAKSLLLCSRSDFLRLSSSKRAAIRSVIYAMILCYRDEPLASECEREDSEAAVVDTRQEQIDTAVASVLRQYRHNVGTLGASAADSWAERDIAREACAIAPNTNIGRHPDWQRVHDAIRQRFNRFTIHIDDSQPIPSGECEVWIKGSSKWRRARYGADSTLHLDSVAAIRPLAA